MVLEEDVGTSKVPTDENASFDLHQLVSQFECVTYFFSQLHRNSVNSYACFD
jgi:hypothetical protein